MSEPQPTEPGQAPSDEARRARIEQLLLSGLDHYFAGQYEQAINIWTRVAFLERGHGRARAYIERARSALAERQRESDELLHAGIAAYNAGDLSAARECLTRALEQGGPNDTALVFLQRLNRLEASSHVGLDTEAPNLAREHAGGPQRPTRGSNWALTLAGSAAAAAAIFLGALPVTAWLAELPVAVHGPVVPPPDPLPIPAPSEIVMERARRLHGEGRWREALRLLDDIPLADPLRPDAERLRADVQKALFAAANAEPSP